MSHSRTVTTEPVPPCRKAFFYLSMSLLWLWWWWWLGEGRSRLQPCSKPRNVSAAPQCSFLWTIFWALGLQLSLRAAAGGSSEQLHGWDLLLSWFSQVLNGAGVCSSCPFSSFLSVKVEGSHLYTLIYSQYCVWQHLTSRHASGWNTSQSMFNLQSEGHI